MNNKIKALKEHLNNLEYDKDINDVIIILNELIILDDISSMFKLGLIYLKGNLTNKNIPKAIYYFSMAAQKGDNKSKYYLGLIYYNGDGINKNYVKSYKLFQSSNIKNSYVYLGIMNFLGLGRNVNYKQASIYFNSTCKHYLSSYYLGLMYNLGLHYKIDYNQAYYFYKSSSKSYNLAKYRLAYLYFYGQGTNKDYQKAYNLFYDAASNGNIINSYNNISIMLYEGIGVIKDKVKALEYYKLIKEQNFNEDFSNLKVYKINNFNIKYNSLYHLNIKSNNYYLREFQLLDYKKMFEIYQNKNFKKNLAHDIKTLNDSYKLSEYIIEQANYINFNSFTICDNSNNEMIGTINFYLLDNLLTIGYILDFEYWNKNIMTSAVFESLNILFKNTNYEKIYAHVNKNNINSIKVLLKLNFKYYMECIDYLSIHKKNSEYIFELTKKDFLKL